MVRFLSIIQLYLCIDNHSSLIIHSDDDDDDDDDNNNNNDLTIVHVIMKDRRSP
jgi:hypothetical protein